MPRWKRLPIRTRPTGWCSSAASDSPPMTSSRRARRFGPINVNRFFTPVPEQPQVAMVLKEPHHQVNVGGAWHTDHSYDEAPALGSMLYALEVPGEGGDTMFASMYKAFEALSPGLQRTLEGLRAVHSQPARLRFQGRLHHGRGRSFRQCRASHPGRRPSGGDSPSAFRTRRPLRQPRFHGPHRRLDERGVTSAAGLSSTASPRARSIPAGSTGTPAAWRSGTTGPPGTTH